MDADDAVELGFCREVSSRGLDEIVQVLIGMNFAFSMSAVKQADAEAMQAEVKATRGENGEPSGPKTDEPAAPEVEAEPDEKAGRKNQS